MADYRDAALSGREVTNDNLTEDSDPILRHLAPHLDPIASKVTAFLLARDQVKPGQGWRASSLDYLARVAANLPTFIAQVMKEAA
jgi:hypothetical protein